MHAPSPATCLALLLTVAAAGCGGDNTQPADTATGTDTGADCSEWPRCADPAPDPADLTVSEGTLVWAKGRRIYVDGGPTLNARATVGAFAMAGGGAYVVRDGTTDLRYVTEGGVEDTGAHADPDTLRASPDGRYVAFLDPDTGDRDVFDTPRLETVVIDTVERRELLRSAEGMGNLTGNDLLDLYEDASWGTVGMTDETLWVDAPSGDYLEVELATGDIREIDEGDPFDRSRPWVQPRHDDDLNSGASNSDGSWSIDTAYNSVRDGFISATDTPLPLRAPEGAISWRLSHWLDNTTAVGSFVTERPGTGDDAPAVPHTLMTCTVPTGACTPVRDFEPTTTRILFPSVGLS